MTGWLRARWEAARTGVRFIPFDAVVARIDAAWRKERPFSLVRLGDGENAILQWPDYVPAARTQWVLSRALENRSYADDEIVAIRNDLIRAVQSADIVGIYDSSETNPWCAIAAPHLRHAGLRHLTACHPAIHFALQGSGELARIIERARRITLLTGRDVLDRFRRRFPHAEVDQIAVPPERSFRLREEKERQTEPHFPGLYHRLLGSLEASGPHHLFLVGAGILGKAYCRGVQAAGGFALDIGSVFDYWAGVPSREGVRTVVKGKLTFAGRTNWASPYLDDPPAPDEVRRRMPAVHAPGTLRRRPLPMPGSDTEP